MQETTLGRFQKKSIVLDGHEFLLHGLPDDTLYFSKIGNNFQPEFMALCRRLVGEDAVCLDIGANIGIKTLYLARHARNGRVIAVEAGPRNAKALSANVKVNNLKNVEVINAAIGDRMAEVKFAENFAWGYVSDKGATVQMRTIDDVANKFDLDRIDFIKIDVEGYEFPILKSSLDVINKYGSLVLVEFNTFTLLAYGNTNPKEFIQWICSTFRNVYVLNRGEAGELTPVTSSDECQAFLSRTIFEDQFSDLLITNCTDRLIPSPQWLTQQLERAVAERDAALAERNAAIAAHDTALAERDVAAAELAAMKASSSWRITAPIRHFVQALRR